MRDEVVSEVPIAGFLVLNDGLALYVAGAAASPGQGIKKAQETIESGRATEKLHEFAVASHALAVV
jgi:anthranilate phosphoribosyltransferase